MATNPLAGSAGIGYIARVFLKCSHLRQRWSDLFGARYEVLLYDLTSTYFECDVPPSETDPRRFGYSRDKRGDCVQVVVALVVTPEGLPLAYEMFPGNTADKTTLRGMLDTIRRRYGAAKRICLMDCGIPTEEVVAELRGPANRRRHRLQYYPRRLYWLKKLTVGVARAGAAEVSVGSGLRLPAAVLGATDGASGARRDALDNKLVENAIRPSAIGKRTGSSWAIPTPASARPSSTRSSYRADGTGRIRSPTCATCSPACRG